MSGWLKSAQNYTVFFIKKLKLYFYKTNYAIIIEGNKDWVNMFWGMVVYL